MTAALADLNVDAVIKFSNTYTFNCFRTPPYTKATVVCVLDTLFISYDQSRIDRIRLIQTC